MQIWNILFAQIKLLLVTRRYQQRTASGFSHHLNQESSSQIPEIDKQQSYSIFKALVDDWLIILTDTQDMLDWVTQLARL